MSGLVGLWGIEGLPIYAAARDSGEVGGSVTHQCFYSITQANKHDRKYWCKLARNRVCYTVISTTGYTSKDHEGRVSLKDIPQNGTFMVTMTGLKKSDTGTYRCGIGTSNSDLYVSLNLTVVAGRTWLGGGDALCCQQLGSQGAGWGRTLEHPRAAAVSTISIP
uniref:Ig-like domain-containing protein n=1 Tax=Falco tinnunculus TaxID=100819 RepID=A0A8C4TTD9_FALTI